MKTIRLTMGRALMRFLDNQYVEFDGIENKFVKGIFSVFGHGNVVGFGEGIEAYAGDIRCYQGKNEQGMALAAVGHAKQANRREIIACTSSIGPGALNFTTAAGTATANRIPLLLFTGDTYACRQPDPVLQQLEQPANYSITASDALQPLCKYWDRVVRPEQLMSALINAFRVLTDPAETGAVTVSMAQDVEGEAWGYPETFFKKRVWHITRRMPNPAEIDRAAALLKSKKKPLLICGGGVLYSEAAETLRTFAEKHNIPFTETQAGKGGIPYSHPLNLAGVGVSGSIAGNRFAAEADLIIAVGTRLGDFITSSRWQFQNPDVDILSINVSAFDTLKMDAHQILADAKLSLQALSDAIGNYKANHSEQIKALKAEWDAEVDRLQTIRRDDGIAQTRLLGEMQKALPKNDVIISAAGSLPDDVRKFWKCESYKGYHCEYGFSCMGYEINAALGAKIAQPNRGVWAVIGDGGWQMLHSELLTAVQENIKINVVVSDNQGFGCIENLQNGTGINTFCTKTNHRDEATGRLTGPPLQIDYAKVAEGYGVKGYTVNTPEELHEALLAAQKEPGCTLIHAKVAHKSMGPRYDSWWRVGVPIISDNPKVMEARKEQDEGLKTAWQY